MGWASWRAPRLIGWRAGAVLLGLFIAHLFFVDEDQRLIFSYIYLGLTVGLAGLYLLKWRGIKSATP